MCTHTHRPRLLGGFAFLFSGRRSGVGIVAGEPNTAKQGVLGGRRTEGMRVTGYPPADSTRRRRRRPGPYVDGWMWHFLSGAGQWPLRIAFDGDRSAVGSGLGT